MTNLLWVLVAILILAWLLGLGGLFTIASNLLWIFLVVAVILAVFTFFTGGYYTR